MDLLQILPQVGLVTSAILNVVTLILKIKERSRKKLSLQTLNLTRILTLEPPPSLERRFRVTFDKKPITDLYLCSVQARNAGNTSIENQAVLVEFNAEVTILETEMTTSPKKEFGPISEDVESKTTWQRRFIIELMEPKDSVTFNFFVTGNKVDLPELAAKGKGLLVELLKPAFQTGAELEAVQKEPLLFLVRLIAAGFLLLFMSFLSVTWLKENGFDVDVLSFSLGTGIAFVIGFIAFFLRAGWINLTTLIRPKVHIGRTLKRIEWEINESTYLWFFYGVLLIGVICITAAFYLRLLSK